MSTPNEQLRKIYLELQNRFETHEYIKVIPFDDEPPEKYEIKYNLSGVIQNAEGKVIESREHSIFINIPFGYPHFPPSCTPQSTTFHPDFDQAAICIGEFWNKDRSLSELIIHIGQMILGKTYSTENAFNEAAVDWYQKNSSRLPFEKINLSQFSKSVSNETEDDSLSMADDSSPLPSIDTLDDADISNRADYLDADPMKLEKEEISMPKSAQPSGKSSVNRIHLLIRQKRYYELSTFLAELSAEDQFEDRAEIESKITGYVQKATDLQKEADEAEHQGDPKSALELFEKIATIVPDFPNLDQNISRTKKSIDLAGEWSGEEDDLQDFVTAPSDDQPSKKGVTFFDDTSKTSIRFIPILGVAIVLVLTVSFVTPYFKARSHLNEGADIYSQCQKLLKIGRFVSAKQTCEDAQTTLQQISLFKRRDRDKMLRDIQQTLTSQDMVQGLSGRILFEGKYVNKRDADKVLEFTKLKKEADLLFEESQWKNAESKYTIALTTAKPILDSIEPIVVREVKEKRIISEINITLERGDSLLSRGELEKGKKMLIDARKKAEKLPEELGGELITRLDPKLKKIEYLQHLDLGKKFFHSNDWESAIKQYEKALRLQGQSPVDGEVGDNTLYANMAEAELYSLINSAKDAFSQAKLSQAISKYEKAIQLVNEKEDLLQRINPKEIKQQLKRIILRTRIVKLKQNADQNLEKKQYREAINSFEEVISAITKDGYQGDKEFRSIIEGTRTTIKETRQKSIIQERINYLVKNYKELFEKNYSAAVPEYLSDPKAVFIKFMDNKELYEIQCLEKNRGRQLRLVMLYSYDPQKNTWQFYSDTN